MDGCGTSIRGIGRRQDGDGGLFALIRCDYPASVVAVVVATRRTELVYLAEHVGPSDVARVLRHLETSHAPTLGASVCYAPACVMAAVLRPTPEADLRPSIASSA